MISGGRSTQLLLVECCRAAAAAAALLPLARVSSSTRAAATAIMAIAWEAGGGNEGAEWVRNGEFRLKAKGQVLKIERKGDQLSQTKKSSVF